MTAPNDVVDRLERLAAHAPAGGIDPDTLWVRGRQRQARRWVTVAACAVVLAGLGALAAPPVARFVDPPIASTPPPSGLVLPDIVRPPERGAPRFARAPGPLSVVGVDGDTGIWGVSGATGVSRFIDLPDDAVPAAGAALSDDGHKLAYWVSDGEQESQDGQNVLTGVAVLDLVSGREQTWESDAPFGVYGDGPLWVDDALWFAAGPWDDAGRYSFLPAVWTWPLDDEPRMVKEKAGGLPLRHATPAAGGVLVAMVSTVRSVKVLEDDGRVTTIRLAQYGSTSSPSMSPDGRWIVGIERNKLSDYAGRKLFPVVAGEVEPGQAEMRRVGGAQAQSVLGWRSATVAIVGSPVDLNGNEVDDGVQASSLDVVTGDFGRLIDIASTRPVSVAADAWAGDVVPTPEVPFVLAPWVLGGSAAVLGVLLLAGWRLVRGRRGHP